MKGSMTIFTWRWHQVVVNLVFSQISRFYCVNHNTMSYREEENKMQKKEAGILYVILKKINYRVQTMVNNDNHFASFSSKKWLQTIIVFYEKKKLHDYHDNRYFTKNTSALSSLHDLVPYGALLPLRPFIPLRPSVLSAGLCPSTAHCPLYGPLSPLQPSVPL